jgi:hypothetical protein
MKGLLRRDLIRTLPDQAAGGCFQTAQAEARSRAEVYEAQVAKMQRALERADQENSRLEQALLQARRPRAHLPSLAE